MIEHTDSSSPPKAKRKPFDIHGFLRRRALLILSLGALVSVVFTPIFRLLMKAHYEAGGALLVDVSKEITLTGREREIVPTNVGDYIRTLVNRITSLDILSTALLSIPREAWPCFCDPQAPVTKNAVMIRKNITVKEEVHSFLITASLKGEKPHGLGTTLNAVFESFLAKLREEQAQNTSLRLRYLQAERARIEERLVNQRMHLLELSNKVANKAFLQGNYSVHLVNLEQIQKLYWEAEAEKALKEGLWRKAKNDEEKLSALALTPYAEERVANNEGINRIEQWTYEQLQTLRTNIDGLTANNKDRLYVEEKMGAMKAYLEGHKKRFNETTNNILSQKRSYDLGADVIRASSALEASRYTRDTLATQLESAKSEASNTAEAIFNASDISYTVSQLRDRLTSLNTRIDDCEMEAKSPIKLSIEAHPSDPSKPARSAGSKALIASLLAGFGCIGGICLAFELVDGRIRSSKHLEGALNGGAPAPIPMLEPPEGIPFAWINHHASHSGAARAIRSLAVRLEKERKFYGGQIFMIAGTGPKVGATSVGLNLADVLSRILPRVLFVEVPAVSSQGSDFLVNESEDLTIALSNIPHWLAQNRHKLGLTVLTPHCRDTVWPSQIRELLELAKEHFDLLLINTEPPSLSDMAQFTLLEVDAAILVAREDHTYYHELQAALDLLTTKPVSAMTAVLNHSTAHKALNRFFLSAKVTSRISRHFSIVRKHVQPHLRLPWRK